MKLFKDGYLMMKFKKLYQDYFEDYFKIVSIFSFLNKSCRLIVHFWLILLSMPIVSLLPFSNEILNIYKQDI